MLDKIIEVIASLIVKTYESYKLNKRLRQNQQNIADSPVNRKELENSLDKGDF